MRRALALVLAGVSAGCGTPAKPITVHFHVGQTRTFSEKELPERSELVCAAGRNTATIEVPPWADWDPHLTYGWTESSVVGDVFFGMKPERHGTLLLVSCARSPGGLD